MFVFESTEVRSRLKGGFTRRMPLGVHVSVMALEDASYLCLEIRIKVMWPLIDSEEDTLRPQMLESNIKLTESVVSVTTPGKI